MEILTPEIVNKEIKYISLNYKHEKITKKILIDHLSKRYKIVCHHCSNDVIYHRTWTGYDGIYGCNNCKNSFSIFNKTILNKSKIEIRKLLKIIYDHINFPRKSIHKTWMEIGGSYKTFYNNKKKCVEFYG